MNYGSLNFNENLRHGTKSMRAIESNSKKNAEEMKKRPSKIKVDREVKRPFNLFQSIFPPSNIDQ